MKRTLAIVLGLSLCGVIAAAAQTQAEIDACKPDAFELCPTCIAKATWAKIVGHKIDRACFFACFKQYRKQLSPACDQVMRNHRH
jgi:hypothetical protein